MNPLRDGALDLVVAPRADALVLVRRDVARDRHAPLALELGAALAQTLREIVALADLRRMTLHAMRDGREIEPAFDRIGHVAVRHRLIGAGEYLARKRGLVDRTGDF